MRRIMAKQKHKARRKRRKGVVKGRGCDLGGGREGARRKTKGKADKDEKVGKAGNERTKKK